MNIYSFNKYPPSEYQSIIKGTMIHPCFRLTWLYQDEQEKEDITDYMILNSGSLSISYNQGQRRSFNFTLNNEDGKFTPVGNNNGIWLNTKFKLELGVQNGDDYIYNNAGIFVLSNPNAIRQSAQKTIDIQCTDKFALIDGTLGGTLETTYEIPSGANIQSAISSILLLDNGNGYPIDSKPIVFDTTYTNAVTQYTLTKSANESLGSLIIELANMISCDVWYGTGGNLVLRSGTRNISYTTKPTLWHFKDTEFEYLGNSTTYDFTDVKNSITVVGANSNGNAVYVGLAENTNPLSPTRVNLIGRRMKYIDDSNIYTQDFAQQRADYELNKASVLQNTIQIESTYMIHLDVNNCIALDDTFFDYTETRFVITTLSIPISVEGKITIDCSNISSLPYYDET